MDQNAPTTPALTPILRSKATPTIGRSLSPQYNHNEVKTPQSRIEEHIDKNERNNNSGDYGNNFNNNSPKTPNLNVSNVSISTPSVVPHGTLRHALGVVEKLQSQLYSIRGELQESDDNLTAYKQKFNDATTEITSLRQKVINLESESAEKGELLLRIRKTQARELEEAIDETMSVKRSLAIEKETVANFENTIKLLENQLGEKHQETEEQTNKAMDLAHRTQIAASNSLQREKSEHNAMKIKMEGEIARLLSENEALKKNMERSGREVVDLKLNFNSCKEEKDTCKVKLEKCSEENKEMRTALEEARISLARYEERGKNNDSLARAYKQGLKASRREVREKADEIAGLSEENAALRSEMDLLIDRNEASLDHIQRICDEKIGQERLLRQRLSSEVKEARSAIMSMHKSVADRNNLLNNLENKLGKIGGQGGGLADLSSVPAISAGVNRARGTPSNEKGGATGASVKESENIDRDFTKFDNILNTISVPGDEARRKRSRRPANNKTEVKVLGQPYRTSGGQAWCIE